MTLIHDKQDRLMAILVNRLRIPVLVDDVLDGREVIDDDTRLAMHEELCEMPPHVLLVCMALCSIKIARPYNEAAATMRELYKESQRILQDYRRLWGQLARNGFVRDEDVRRYLPDIAADLMNMAELLDLSLSFLKKKDMRASALCDILGIQAKAHAMVAEEYCRVMGLQNAARFDLSGDEDICGAFVFMKMYKVPENVVKFETSDDARVH